MKQYLFTHKWRFFLIIPLTILGIVLMAAGCDDTNTVNNNSNVISNNQPIRSSTYSDRREVLLDWETQVLDNPYLRTCTIVTSRGGQESELAIASTIGMPVNLGNEVTAPSSPEADGVYVSQSQPGTVFKLRNGRAFYVEADANAVTGDCAPDTTLPATALQAQVTYQEGLPPSKPSDTSTNFLGKKP